MGGGGRLFVSEQSGTVHIFYPKERRWQRTPFLDISSRVKVGGCWGGEVGGWGLAVGWVGWVWAELG